MDYNVGHGTTAALAADLELIEAAPFDAPTFTNGAASVSADEAAFFKTNGFLLKRGLLDEPEIFARIVDHFWRQVPRGLIERDDPSTWTSGAEGAWTETDVVNVGRLYRGNWKARSRDGIGTEPFIVDAIANHPHMLGVVESFLGTRIKRVQRVRGIYAIFPYPSNQPQRLGPHADYMAAQLAAMVFIDDIPPRAGGFTVWPGSHHLLHPHWDTVHGGTMAEARKQGFQAARDEALRTISPIEFSGRAGDVVFWHPRLLHSGGVNHSAQTKPVCRLIVPCDYQTDTTTRWDDLEFGPGPDYQWWIDTRNFREDPATTEDNIFAGWAI